VLLDPDRSSTFPHETIGCGKNSAIDVLDRDNRGKVQSSSNSQILQELDNQVEGTGGDQATDHCFTTPTFWQQTFYVARNNDVVKGFTLNASSGNFPPQPTSKGSFELVLPGAQPVVSANGASNGIVWVVDDSSSVALHAYDATIAPVVPSRREPPGNLTKELYRSPGLGTGVRFVVPTVVNGKVYVGTAGKLFVFAPH
jgi:hypothetical protein